MPRQDQKIRTVIRMAVRLRERLAEFGQVMPVELPEANWQDCRRLARLVEKAITRGWFQAAARIRPQIVRALNELERSLHDVKVRLSPIRSGALVSFGEFHAELAGLCAEFPTAECNLQRNAIRVITEPVVLEDVYLGAFLIELDLKSGEDLSYSVLAIEPHPAANAEVVTHPHVQGNGLCEGEGGLPIRRALDEGRVFDFFQIVVQLLNTYDAENAYVKLEEWEGVSCIACGAPASSEECRRCSASGDPLCAECIINCSSCDRDYSPDFGARCSTCDEQFCYRCLDGENCEACRREARIKR